jgi:hypothetical protein
MGCCRCSECTETIVIRSLSCDPPPVRGTLAEASRHYDEYLAHLEAQKRPPAVKIIPPPQIQQSLGTPPTPPAAAASAHPPQSPSNIPCRFHQNGCCKRGDKCPFSHKPSTMCPWQSSGHCKFGLSCTYQHSHQSTPVMLEWLLKHLSALFACHHSTTHPTLLNTA